MLKKNLVIAIPVLVLALVLVYFFTDWPTTKLSTWDAIPENTSLVIEIDNAHNLFKKLENENEVWESLKLNKTIQDFSLEISSLDSVRKFNALKMFNTSPLLISLHFNQISKFTEALFVSDLSISANIETLRKTVANRWSLKPLSGAIYVATDTLEQHVFYLSMHGNLLIASANEDLVKQALATISSETQGLLNDSNLQKIRSTAGSKVDARVFIQYSFLGDALLSSVNPNLNKQLLWLNSFSDWTEVDVLVKKNEVLMSGFTTNKNGKQTYLNYFKEQTPVDIGVFNILPFNTNLLLWLGFSDFTAYPFSGDIKSSSTNLNFNLNNLFQFFDGEIALASNSSNQKSIHSQSWFLAHISNPSKVEALLNQISKNSNGVLPANYSGFPIGKINSEGLIPELFGDAFATIRKNWYTLIGNYVIIGNSKESLENFIRLYETGKTLDLNENFKTFSDNISTSANILLFSKPRDFTEKGSAYLSKKTFNILKANEKTLTNFEGLVFQFSNEGDVFFTNFYLKNNKKYKEENLALWKTQLDDEIAGKPYLVKDHNTGNFNVVVFDKSANFYLVSTDGRILWKKRVDALPESPIYEVDYYKNGKIQYLFNSPDFIYLIDKNGDFVEGYPKKLNPSATNGLSLMDYNNNKDYRLVVAQADKRIYNYKINGKQVNGWSKPRTDNLVLEQVQRLVATNKDYFMVTDSEDEISILNRKGNQRIKLKQNPEKAKNSFFYVNKTNSKGIILSTDVRGKLFYISKSGVLKYTDFGDFSESHFFLYEDFNGDGSPDFIYLDGDELKVFDRFKNILFRFKFDSPISIKPEFFKLTKRKKVMGVVADLEKTIYLFDNKGNTLISKGLVGETPFTVGSLENNNDLNLVTGTGNTLYNYRID